MSKLDKKTPRPRLIAFEITRCCRYHCPHCRAAALSGPADGELTTEQAKKTIDSLAKYSKCVLIFTGGEPMEREDIYQLVRHSRNVGLRAVMATCGYLINEESISRLKKAGIMALSFSLDGASAETHDGFRKSKGAFDATIRAAKIAKKAGVRFQINTTISKLNADEIVGICELAKRLGAYCFNPFILVPAGRGKNMADEILDPVEYERILNELIDLKLTSGVEIRVTCGPQFARLCRQKRIASLSGSTSGCMGGRGFGFISYRGDVQICGFLDVSAGNLLENNFDFAKIWEQSKFLNEIRDRSSYSGRCGRCEFLGVCGGCRARAYAMTGDYLEADLVCSYEPGINK